MLLPIPVRAPTSHSSPGRGPPFVKSLSCSHGPRIIPRGAAKRLSIPIDLTASFENCRRCGRSHTPLEDAEFFEHFCAVATNSSARICPVLTDRICTLDPVLEMFSTAHICTLEPRLPEEQVVIASLLRTFHPYNFKFSEHGRIPPDCRFRLSQTKKFSEA